MAIGRLLGVPKAGDSAAEIEGYLRGQKATNDATGFALELKCYIAMMNIHGF